MTTHELKTWPTFFVFVAGKSKRFELRKNDRDFHIGDQLLLREWEEGSGYSGREELVEVEHILFGNGTMGLAEGHCIMSISHPDEPHWSQR